MSEFNNKNSEDSLNKRRYVMPQIIDVDKMIADLSEHDIGIARMKIDPNELVPTQKEYNPQKVQDLIDDFDNIAPIIISNDDYIIDGHHRWYAAFLLKEKIDCIVIDLTIEEVLDFLKEKDYIETKKLHENFLILDVFNDKPIFERKLKMAKKTLQESSLSRVWRQAEAHVCAFVSASRMDNDASKNRSNNKTLHSQIMNLGYGATAVVGRWPETQEDGSNVLVKEMSFFVVNLDDDKNFIDNIMKMGIQWKQDAVLIIPKGGTGCYTIDTRNDNSDPDYVLTIDKKRQLGRVSYNNVTSVAFTALGHSRIVVTDAPEVQVLSVDELRESLNLPKTYLGNYARLVEGKRLNDSLGIMVHVKR